MCHAAFDRACKRVVLGFTDGRIRLYDCRTGKLLGEGMTQMGSPVTVAFHPAGELIVTAVAGRGLMLWDCRTLKLRSMSPGPAACLGDRAFSQDLRYVVTAGSGRQASQQLVVFDLLSIEALRVFDLGGGSVCAVTCSADDTCFVTADESGVVCAVDRRTGRCLARSERPPSEFWAPIEVVITPAQDFVLVMSEVGNATVWAIGSGWKMRYVDRISCQQPLWLHGEHDIVMRRQGESVQLFDCRTQKRRSLPLAALSLSHGSKVGLHRPSLLTDGEIRAISKDRTLQWSHRDSRVSVLGSSNGECLGTLSGPSPIVALAVSPDGTRVATGGEDSIVRLWDPVACAQVASLGRASGGVAVLAWSADGRCLIVGAGDGALQVWGSVPEDR